MQFFNIATLNTQGCIDKTKRHTIALDAERYKIQILALTETHVVEKNLEEIKIGKKTYNIYHNGIEGENKFSGVGILIEKHIEATFARISDRICIAEVNLENSVKMFIIVVYAHTLTVSEKKKKYQGRFL